MKLVVGQKVFIRSGYGGYMGNEIKEDTVETVGRKYFTLKGRPRSKYNIENGHKETKFSVDEIVYESKHQLLIDIETTELVDWLCKNGNRHTYTKLPLAQLRNLKLILQPI